MTKSATRSDQPKNTLFPFMPALDPALFGNLTQSGESCAKACGAWQQEMSRFITSRLQWDSQVGKALASCNTLQEVAEVQRDWLQSTTEQYFDEINRLTQLAAKIMPMWMSSFNGSAQPPSKKDVVHEAAE